MKIERQFGETLGVSIGTAIPLELMLADNIHKGYEFIYLNLRTLYRNFHGAYPRDQYPTSKVMAKDFLEELITIQSLITETIPGRLKPIFYLASCSSLPSLITDAKLKVIHTPKQKEYYDLERVVFALALKANKDINVQNYNCLVKGNNTSSLMVSHLPLDLISSHLFRKLGLLESHTGAIKLKTEWITKLNKNEIYRNIPFNILSIQILGDNNNQFQSMGTKFTKYLVQLATDHNWNANTNMAKVQYDIRKLNDKYLASILLNMSHVKLI